MTARELPLAPDTPGLPDLQARLSAFTDHLTQCAGDSLACLALFGGLARGRFRPGLSDVNVVIVLRKAGTAELRALAPALSAGWRSARVTPMILAHDQLEQSARAFPTKLLDIQLYHLVLAGEDVFASIRVPRDRVLWRVEQELLNLAIRLRRRVAVSTDEALPRELATIARPLAIELSWLLRMQGGTVTAEDRTAAIFAAAATAFSLDAPALATLAALRQDPAQTTAPLTPADLCDRVIQCINTAAHAAASS